jgi:hypothetical protein
LLHLCAATAASRAAVDRLRVGLKQVVLVVLCRSGDWREHANSGWLVAIDNTNTPLQGANAVGASALGEGMC